jgi:tetratricopeptide (TPR) repeat protein
VFFRRKKYDLSYMYHGKHAEHADDSDRFVALYNAGICSRMMGEQDRSLKEFAEAFQVAMTKDDFESMSLTHGQLAICHVLRREYEPAKKQFEQCLMIAQQLKASKMQLECLLCLAYISFDEKQWLQAKQHFEQAYKVSDQLITCKVAKEAQESVIAEQCLCNAGIASGNAQMDSQQKHMYKTQAFNFFKAPSEESEEDEEAIEYESDE